MGDWRTVHIDGTIDAGQVDAAKAVCDYGDDYENFHALSYLAKQPSLCGLHNWPATRINAVGNCAERDYSVESVAEHLRLIVAAAPSFTAKVHCGGNYESKDCVATITVAGGEVVIGEPECGELPEIDKSQMMGRLFMAMQR